MKGNYYINHGGNQILADGILNILKKLGYGGLGETYVARGAEIITIELGNNDKYRALGWMEFKTESDRIYLTNHKQITIEDFVRLFHNEKSIKVVLNEKHTALVTKNGIKVGCEFFPLTVINELMIAKQEVLK